VDDAQYATDPSQVRSFKVKLNGLLPDFIRYPLMAGSGLQQSQNRQRKRWLPLGIEAGFDLLLSGLAIGTLTLCTAATCF